MHRFLAVPALALLAACSSPSPYQNAEVGGNVTYRQKIVYGPDATLVVYLIDASGPESPLEVELQKLDDPTPGAELLASSTTEGMITSPTKFSLPIPLGRGGFMLLISSCLYNSRRFCCWSSGGGRRERRASARRRTSSLDRSACRMIQGAPLQG
jgi:hypothetical protein